MRAVFFDEDHARQAVDRLLHDGFEATCGRQPFAGEDDDEDHPWVVQTDASAVVLEVLVDQHDGWLEPDETPSPTSPLVLPCAPRRGRGGDNTP